MNVPRKVFGQGSQHSVRASKSRILSLKCDAECGRILRDVRKVWWEITEVRCSWRLQARWPDVKLGHSAIEDFCVRVRRLT